MTNQPRITVDTASINAMFRDLNLSASEPKKAIRSALRDSGNIIKRAVIGGLSSVSSDPLKRKGVRTVVYKNAEGVRIDIYKGFYRGGVVSRTTVFNLRWFEEGTKARYTRDKGLFRGATAAKSFFITAAQSATAEAERSLEENIIKRIKKIAEKHK